MARYRFELREPRFDAAFSAFETLLAEVGQPAERLSVGCLADSLAVLRAVIGRGHVGRACTFVQRAMPLREWLFGPETALLMAVRTSLPVAEIWGFEREDYTVRDWRGRGQSVASFCVRVHDQARGKILPADVPGALAATLAATVAGKVTVADEGNGRGRAYHFDVPKASFAVVIDQLLRRLDGIYATSAMIFGGTLGQIEYLQEQGRYQPTDVELLPGLGGYACTYGLEPTQDLGTLPNCSPEEAKAIGRRAWERREHVPLLRLRRALAPWAEGGLRWDGRGSSDYCELAARQGALSIELTLASPDGGDGEAQRRTLRAIAAKLGAHIRTLPGPVAAAS